MNLIELFEKEPKAQLSEKYLGMADVDREDIGAFVRKRLSVALKMSLDSNVEAERLLNINPQKIAKIIHDKVKAKEDFLLVIHGYTKEVSDADIEAGKAKKVEHTFLITNVFAIAKKIDLELVNAGDTYVYVIDELSKEYAKVDKQIVTISSLTSMIKAEVKYLISAYDLKIKDTGAFKIGAKPEKEEKETDSKK